MSKPLVEQFLDSAALDMGFDKWEHSQDHKTKVGTFRFWRQGDYLDFWCPIGTSLEWTRPLLIALKNFAYSQDKDPTQILREAHGLL